MCFTITVVMKIIRRTEDFVALRFVIYRFHCTMKPVALYQNMQFLTTLHSAKVNLLSGHVPNLK